jgi:CheY-like chemotaxis protein
LVEQLIRNELVVGSSPTVGSIFFFFHGLGFRPVDADNSESNIRERSDRSARRKTTQNHKAIVSARILIVEDEKMFREMLTVFIEREGHGVVESENGFDAMQRLEEQAFDLMIIDMVMPGQGGLETILQGKKKWPSVKILGISGAVRNTTRTILDWAKKAGADSVISKPFESDELLTAVRELLAPPE